MISNQRPHPPLLPGLYNYKGPHLGALGRALLEAQGKIKLGRFTYDTAAGEVRFAIRYPIEDGTLTEKTLFRLIDASHYVAEKFAPVFRRVIETGKVEFEEQSDPPRGKTLGEGARALN